MLLVYNVETGIIIAKIPKGQPYSYLEGENNHLILNEYPDDWHNHKVVGNQLIKLNNIEVAELNTYRKVLGEQERFEITMLNKLNPSFEEIKKAKNTIEILELLSEVL